MSRRWARLQAGIGGFLNQYCRKRRPGGLDPNDRKYSRKMEKAVLRMDPEDLGRMMYGGDGAVELTGHLDEELRDKDK